MVTNWNQMNPAIQQMLQQQQMMRMLQAMSQQQQPATSPNTQNGGLMSLLGPIMASAGGGVLGGGILGSLFGGQNGQKPPQGPDLSSGSIVSPGLNPPNIGQTPPIQTQLPGQIPTSGGGLGGLFQRLFGSLPQG